MMDFGMFSRLLRKFDFGENSILDGYLEEFKTLKGFMSYSLNDLVSKEFSDGEENFLVFYKNGSYVGFVSFFVRSNVFEIAMMKFSGVLLINCFEDILEILKMCSKNKSVKKLVAYDMGNTDLGDSFISNGFKPYSEFLVYKL